MHSSLGKILSTIVGFVLSQAKRGDSQFTQKLKFLEIPLRTYYIYIYILKRMIGFILNMVFGRF